VALPRAHRLKRRADFETVYQRGFRRRSQRLTLVALRHHKLLSKGAGVSAPTEQVGAASRIGISISQKVSKRAVVRNRIKRQLRAALRHLLVGFPEGWDMVVVVHPPAIQCDYLEFLRELEQLLIDAEVLHGHS
jgi:ribonuclease P protein component